MTKYKLEINAENELEAKNKIIEMCKNNELDEKYLDKIDEPIKWIDEATEDANDIFEEHKEEFDEIINNKIKPGSNDTDEIYYTIYQDMDLVDICHEWIDGSGRFIYYDSASVKGYIDCLRDLDEYEETDSGLWDGLEPGCQQISAQAFWTFRNAIMSLLENQLKEYINSKLNNE